MDRQDDHDAAAAHDGDAVPDEHRTEPGPQHRRTTHDAAGAPAARPRDDAGGTTA